MVANSGSPKHGRLNNEASNFQRNYNVFKTTFLVHDPRTHNIFLVNGSDVYMTYRYRRLRLFSQKLQQRFERSESRGVHHDAPLVCLERLHHLREVALHVLLDVLHVVLSVHHQQRRAGDGPPDVWSHNFHTDCALQQLMVHVLALDSATNEM